MELEEIEKTLYRVAKLRMPNFKMDPDDPMAVPAVPHEKIEGLESYLLDAAVGRGDAHEARLFAYGAHRTLREEWDHLEGWEIQFGAKAATATQPQVKEAKRQLRPDLFDAIEKADWLVRRLTEQVKRLEKDEEVASRVYTLITGG
jgi:hypothetical protein